ncbi:MAG TPA: GNAT family N-acetyltransferase [Ktedonobacteraceae bacterium]|nr:GNAT family N-acetyltransferase [Ktedonobacteraceae bacterium]
MVTIREACIEDAAGMAKVHVDSWRTTYAGIVPDAYLANLSYARRENLWRDILGNISENKYRFVAVNDAGQIVGFVSGGPKRNGDPMYQAELYSIYLLQKYQGQGIGRQLTRRLVERFLQAGIRSMLLWVFVDNPSCRFYEALGGQRLQVEQADFDGVLVDEVAYGWPDISVILQGKR